MIVELSTGHVFERGSVKGVGPLARDSSYYAIEFDVIGVGFKEKIKAQVPVEIRRFPELPANPGESYAENHQRRFDAMCVKATAWAEALRQEFIDKLLDDGK